MGTRLVCCMAILVMACYAGAADTDSTTSTQTSGIRYDSDALARLARQKGLWHFASRNGSDTRLRIRFDACADLSSSPPLVRFEALSPKSKEKKAWTFDASTGEAQPR